MVLIDLDLLKRCVLTCVCEILRYSNVAIIIICPTLHSHAVCDFTTMVPPGYGYELVGYTVSIFVFLFVFASDSSGTMMSNSEM